MFKIGDVVQVKSGGPAMTVIAVGDQVECLWFAEANETFRRDLLPAICLEPVEFEEAETADDDEDEDDDED